jgi:hypothetical protein
MLLKDEKKELRAILQVMEEHEDQLTPREAEFYASLQEEFDEDGHVTPAMWTWAQNIRDRLDP